MGLLLLAWAACAATGRVPVRVGWRVLAPGVALFGALELWFLLQASGTTPAGWDHALWRPAADALQTPLDGAISLSPDATVTGVMRFAAYAGVFLLALQFGRDARRARILFWVLAIAGLVYALYGLVLMFGRIDTILWFERWAYQGSLTSSFVNRNSYGTYAGLTLIAALALGSGSMGRSLELGLRSRTGLLHFIDNLQPKVFFLTVLLTVIATALLLSRSRGALLAAVLGLVAYFAMLGLRRRQHGRAVLGYAVGVLIAGAVLVSFSGSATLARFAELATDGDGRGAVFALTARAIGERPLLGTGLGTYRGVFQLYRDDGFDVLTPAYTQAHSSYLEMALDAGLPAFAAMMVLLAGLAGWCVRGALKRRRNVAFPAAGLGATTLVAAHSALDFSLQIPAVAVTYMALMGAAVGQSFNSRNNGADSETDAR
jgi:O-antigen ligase